MRLSWLSGLLLVLMGYASDSSLSYTGGREPDGMSLLVRGGPEASLDEWAVFLPVGLKGPGIEGLNSEAPGPPGSHRPPLLNPRPTPQQRMEIQLSSPQLIGINP